MFPESLGYSPLGVQQGCPVEMSDSFHLNKSEHGRDKERQERTNKHLVDLSRSRRTRLGVIKVIILVLLCITPKLFALYVCFFGLKVQGQNKRIHKLKLDGGGPVDNRPSHD